MTASTPAGGSGSSSWLADAARAARVVDGRADLWLPGALGHLVYVGWLPLLVTVAPVPDVGDLAFLGVRLVSATNFPLNVIALVMAMLLVAGVACLAAAFAEVVLIAQAQDRWPPPHGVASATRSGLVVVVVVAIPVAGALAALLLGLTAVAPDVFLRTPSQAEIPVRLLERLWPFLAALATALVGAQSIGAGALRELGSGRRSGAGAALTAGLVGLARQPARRLGASTAGLVVDLLAFTGTTLLLGVLWAPIGAALADGRFPEPRTWVLLLGFIAIWLALVLGAGALRAWISTWWSLVATPQS